MFDINQLLSIVIGSVIFGGGIGYWIGRINVKYEIEFKDELFEDRDRA